MKTTRARVRVFPPQKAQVRSEVVYASVGKKFPMGVKMVVPERVRKPAFNAQVDSDKILRALASNLNKKRPSK